MEVKIMEEDMVDLQVVEMEDMLEAAKNGLAVVVVVLQVQ